MIPTEVNYRPRASTQMTIQGEVNRPRAETLQRLADDLRVTIGEIIHAVAEIIMHGTVPKLCRIFEVVNYLRQACTRVKVAEDVMGYQGLHTEALQTERILFRRSHRQREAGKELRPSKTKARLLVETHHMMEFRRLTGRHPVNPCTKPQTMTLSRMPCWI
jgi:hypothetical protein